MGNMVEFKLKDDFGRFTQGNDLNKKYSDVKANKVFQYVNNLELKVRQSNFWIFKLKFLFQTVTRCVLVNNVNGKCRAFQRTILADKCKYKCIWYFVPVQISTSWLTCLEISES